MQRRISIASVVINIECKQISVGIGISRYLMTPYQREKYWCVLIYATDSYDDHYQLFKCFVVTLLMIIAIFNYLK